MRIGEVLGLRHEDIHCAGKNEIHVLPRFDNYNQARAKTGERIIHVSKDLMRLYSDYLIDEYPEDVDSDYVFVNIWEGTPGTPIKYPSADSLFRRLHKKTGIKTSPHILRHTHATELIKAGWDIAHIQKRLGQLASLEGRSKKEDGYMFERTWKRLETSTKLLSSLNDKACIQGRSAKI